MSDVPGRARGATHPAARLTDDAVREIRAAPARSGATLAQKFGVSRATVSLVRARKIWTHVVDLPPSPANVGELS